MLWEKHARCVNLCSKSRFAKAETSKWFIFVSIQPSVDCPLWSERSSWDGRCSWLWSQHPDLSNTSACLARLAFGRKGAARSLRLPGVWLKLIYAPSWRNCKYWNELAVLLTDTFVCMCVCWGEYQIINAGKPAELVQAETAQTSWPVTHSLPQIRVGCLNHPPPSLPDHSWFFCAALKLNPTTSSAFSCGLCFCGPQRGVCYSFPVLSKQIVIREWIH